MTTTGPWEHATVRPCPYRARAWWGDECIADSTRAQRVDGPDRDPTLWFPWDDVRTTCLRSNGAAPADGGVFERFDAVGPVPERNEPVTWGEQPGRARDGVGVVHRCVTAPEGLAALRDYALVDHDRVRVELVDTVEGDDPRALTVKRFPTWGDATDLIAVLDTGAVVADRKRPVVEGSQLLAQTIVQAMRHAPDRRAVSAHMVFLRAAGSNEPVAITLETLTSGRTFSAFGARVEQRDRLCASGTALLGVAATDVVRHAEGARDVPGPYDAVPYDMGVTGRDVRVVDAAYTDDPDAPVGPPSIDAWVRFRAVPDEPALHAGLLAQFTGHMSIAAALRPHPGIAQREAHRTISTAINAIAISFHADVRMDRWVCYRHLATVVADGMAHSECRVHDQSGALVASFTVDAMIRPLDRPGADARTAL
jgi:acyl-CoA thioesterase